MGRSHVLSGMAAGMAAAAATGSPPLETAFLGCLTACAAVLPDLDHPDSTVSRTWGIGTQAFAWVVCRLSGGHRNGTHSGFGAAVFTLAAFAATAMHLRSPQVALAGCIIAAVLALSGAPIRWLYGPCGSAYKTPWGPWLAGGSLLAAALVLTAAYLTFGPIAGTVALTALMALAMSAGVRTFRIPGKIDDAAALALVGVALWLQVDLTLAPAALALGVVVHIAGDAITVQGVPWGWPYSQRNIGPKVIVTNGPEERKFLVPAFVIAVGVVEAAQMGWLAGAGAAAALAGLMAAGRAPQETPARQTALHTPSRAR